MENVAVLDFGSARMKMRAMEHKENGETESFFYSDETHLATNVDENNTLPLDYFHNVFMEKVKHFIGLAKKHNCKKMLSIGTHIFRELKNADYVTKELEPYIGKINIISGETEGAIFYDLMKSKLDTPNFLLIDVGGGSVQMIGEKGDACYSTPTGTFSLEKLYQKSKEKAEQSELSNMESHVSEAIDKVWKYEKNGYSLLVLGSSHMESLMNSMADFAKSEKVKKGYRKEFELTDFEEIYDEIKCQPYKSLAGYYPANPVMLGGVDKTLIHTITTAKKFNISKVLPTNESTSSALLELLAKKPEALVEKGLEIFELN
ncbi:MAG: hypothetical protein LBL47_01865 [Lactobacillus sp.]|jgi:exopolyphosphatase/pppGpp-phosphohydrolase|nr:hypothetical protein [Lactobacillus sp.]